MSEINRIYVAVVDDDDSARRSLSRLLQAAGFQPITYALAESFLADKNRPQFGCLVLDIQLGGMSGIELAQKLVAEGVRTPTIFITAHDHPEARTEAQLRVARHISAKPIPVPKCSRPSGGWRAELHEIRIGYSLWARSQGDRVPYHREILRHGVKDAIGG